MSYLNIIISSLMTCQYNLIAFIDIIESTVGMWYHRAMLTLHRKCAYYCIYHVIERKWNTLPLLGDLVKVHQANHMLPSRTATYNESKGRHSIRKGFLLKLDSWPKNLKTRFNKQTTTPPNQQCQLILDPRLHKIL